MKKYLFLASLLLAVGSCNRETYCTEIWVVIGISVNGPALDDHFTIRENTGDTLREANPDGSGLFYWVLDDTWQKTLAGKEERFRFVGILNDTVALDIPFRIGADDCHVYKVSGPEEVTL
jgi:hypothetical protein